MRLYHTTDAAESILRDGFRDATDTYMTTNAYTGVWLADSPLDINEGAAGDVTLILDIPEHEVAPYEWVEEGKPHLEFLVPATVVNRYPVEIAEGES